MVKDVGKAYFLLAKYSKCIKFYKLLEDMNLQSESILYYLSVSYRELKNYELATLYANKTIEEGISANTAAYYALLGNIYEERRENANASKAYKKGLAFKANSSLNYRLALLYDLKLKQPKAALQYYKQFIKSKTSAVDVDFVTYAKNRVIEINQPKASKSGLTSIQK